jgi:hypothetical protein
MRRVIVFSRQIKIIVPWVLALLCPMSGTWAASPHFPPDEQWDPLPCGINVMIDGLRDGDKATEERDLVGDLVSPAGLTARDEGFLYLRLRLDKSPLLGPKLRPFAWGILFKMDLQVRRYELLLMVDGKGEKVHVYINTVSTFYDDPQDPPNIPPRASFAFATHGTVQPTADSHFDNDEDFFLSLAVPWSTLKPLGLSPATPVMVWAGSSSTTTSLNGDFACHQGSSVDLSLSTIDQDWSVLDIRLDSDGDGYSDDDEIKGKTDPSNPQSHPSTPPPTYTSKLNALNLEGGGGCELAPAEKTTRALPPMGLLLFLLLSAFVLRHRR